MFFFNYPTSPASITEVESLSPKIQRIRISNPSIQNKSWQRGDKVKVQINSTLRSYTPARVNVEEGWMDLIFFLHGKGQASDWAKSAQVGMNSPFLGPARSMPFIDTIPDWVMFLGDETTVGLAVNLLEGLPQSVKKYGAIELAQEDQGCLKKLNLNLQPAIRSDTHGTPLLSWLKSHTLLEGTGLVWLSGEVTSVRMLKQELLSRGLKRTQIKIKPYWSIRGHKHRKQIQRAL